MFMVTYIQALFRVHIIILGYGKKFSTSSLRNKSFIHGFKTRSVKIIPAGCLVLNIGF